MRLMNTDTQKEKAVKLLGEYRELIWPLVEKSLAQPKFPRQFAIPPAYQKEIDKTWQIAREYPNRKGKYLRPSLVMLVNEALGGDRDRAAITAAAMQISEEWILTHDDVEDGSEMRRGKPALHKIYGVNQAINAGDMLTNIMWKVLMTNEDKLRQKLKSEIMEEFNTMLARTVLGQSVEIRWNEENKTDLTDADWEFIADSKTGYYSITGPIRLGAIVAGASKDQLDRLTDFGLFVGRCFQLVDDLLDLTGDFAGLKQHAGDLYERKRTVMLGHLIRMTTGEDRLKLAGFLGKDRQKIRERDVSWVLKMMQKYGSIEYGKQLAQKYRDEAMKRLELLDFLEDNQATAGLKLLTEFVLKRDH